MIVMLYRIILQLEQIKAETFQRKHIKDLCRLTFCDWLYFFHKDDPDSLKSTRCIKQLSLRYESFHQSTTELNMDIKSLLAVGKHDIS